jgi:hypothetical protein
MTDGSACGEFGPLDALRGELAVDARQVNARIVRRVHQQLTAAMIARGRRLCCRDARDEFGHLSARLRERLEAGDAGGGALRILLDGSWLFSVTPRGELGPVNRARIDVPETPPVDSPEFAAGRESWQRQTYRIAVIRRAELRRREQRPGRSRRPRSRSSRRPRGARGPPADDEDPDGDPPKPPAAHGAHEEGLP